MDCPTLVKLCPTHLGPHDLTFPTADETTYLLLTLEATSPLKYNQKSQLSEYTFSFGHNR